MKRTYFAAVLAIMTVAMAYPLGAYVIDMSISLEGEIVRHRWKSSAFPLTWRMNPVQGSNIAGSRTQADVFSASFAAWQSVTTASVSFTRGPDTEASVQPVDDNINLISTNTSASDFPDGVLALTATSVYSSPGFDPVNQRTIDFAGQIAEADIYFNPTVSFSTDSTPVADLTDLQAVATHEIGHLLGLDHSPLVSATMFWSLDPGSIYSRNISTDDAAAISILYPSSLFASKGKISGVVRTTANAPVFGAVVVAVNSGGAPVASAVTDPGGAYLIEGLDAGSYTVYAEPLDGPVKIGNITSLSQVYPGVPVNATFASRAH